MSTSAPLKLVKLAHGAGDDHSPSSTTFLVPPSASIGSSRSTLLSSPSSLTPSIIQSPHGMKIVTDSSVTVTTLLVLPTSNDLFLSPTSTPSSTSDDRQKPTSNIVFIIVFTCFIFGFVLFVIIRLLRRRSLERTRDRVDLVEELDYEDRDAQSLMRHMSSSGQWNIYSLSDEGVPGLTPSPVLGNSVGPLSQSVDSPTRSAQVAQTLEVADTPQNEVRDTIDDVAQDLSNGEQLSHETIDLIASRVAELLQARNAEGPGRMGGQGVDSFDNGSTNGIARRSSMPARHGRFSASESIVPPSEAPPVYEE